MQEESYTILCINFYNWLTSLSMMSSGFLYVAACITILFTAMYYSIVCVHHISFICSCTGGHIASSLCLVCTLLL